MRRFLQAIAIAISPAMPLVAASSSGNAAMTAIAEIGAPPWACYSDNRQYKPRMYVANLLTIEEQKNAGRTIADALSSKFLQDGHFEVVSRKEINNDISPYFKKNPSIEEYKAIVTTLGNDKHAECIILGQIAKSSSRAKVLIRLQMIAPATGETRYSTEQEIEGKDIPAFTDRSGNTFLAYFQTTPLRADIQAPPRQVRESKMAKYTFSGWGGYNLIHVDSTTRSALDIVESIPGSSSKLGGIGGGSDGWMRFSPSLELGGGVAFLPLYQYKYDRTIGNVTTKYDFNIRYMPVMLQARVITDMGFYAGVGVGFFFGISNVSVSVRDNTTGISAAGTATAGGSAFGANIMLGWQVPISDALGVDLGVKGWFIAEDGTGIAATPYAGMVLKF
jgi:hypothetical protein